MNAYTAITIGPIYRTLQKARSTKAYWSASYLFSWIMQQLAVELRDEKLDIISPYIPDKAQLTSDDYKGVGLFPDRLFLKGSVSEETWKRITEKMIDHLATVMSADSAPKKEVYDYLTRYIQIKKVGISIEKDQGFLVNLNQYLDTQELWQRTTNGSDELLEKFIENTNCFTEENFGKGRPFRSISEIAVSGWRDPEKYLDENSEVDYSELAREEGYRNCYKYMAIIKADGDNFGRYIQQQTAESMKRFSKHFFDFSIDVAKKLRDETNAVPIYIGGDDLFLFAPVIDHEKDIFELIRSIDECFKNFRDQINDTENLSLSYGVSIFYHKSPMSEAMEVADEMLRKAKSTETKNCVAVSIRKHSGQTIEFVLPPKSEPIYHSACEMVQAFTGDDIAMLNGLSHWINEMYDNVIKHVARDRQRLKAVFENFFNEDIHRTQKRFLEKVEGFIADIHQAETVNDKDNDEAIRKLLYGLLRYCQFINAKDEK